ncbi:GAF and ANTAR domain-containing protein [Cryptosporangium phraense]|uniref:GAF and ANTAR domain-containing protein n=1 Tax=Cryptosporangium phraense TaxID=2593070 RepID=A0A545AMV2_9ACTN|nr:GAF and ANTAR domain-containing protein [Cryptosporangium phraense]TQS42591.1 GAF and ANTAR domain-containing protein [Cryptosporangium phraense]
MELSDEQLRELMALSGLVLSQTDLISTLQEVTRIAARIVPGAEAASITALQDGRPAAVAFSDEWSRELDEMQFAEREGPCLDATRTGNLFRVRDLATEGRWPAYVERAVAFGARSVVSLPLHSEGVNFGALNLYSRDPDAFTGEAVALAQVLASHAGQASQVAAAFFRHRDLAEQLREAIRSRTVIDQAIGVLMAQRKVPADDGFTLLREASQHLNVKLREVAQQVVETGELPWSRR